MIMHLPMKLFIAPATSSSRAMLEGIEIYFCFCHERTSSEIFPKARRNQLSTTLAETGGVTERKITGKGESSCDHQKRSRSGAEMFQREKPPIKGGGF
jgi:hypothetical protein